MHKFKIKTLQKLTILNEVTTLIETKDNTINKHKDKLFKALKCTDLL